MSPEQERIKEFFEKDAGPALSVEAHHPLIKEFGFLDGSVCIEFPWLHVVVDSQGHYTPVSKLAGMISSEAEDG